MQTCCVTPQKTSCHIGQAASLVHGRRRQSSRSTVQFRALTCCSRAGFAVRGSNRSTRASRLNSLVVRAEKDYYKTLGVSRDADKKQIKSAYRSLARKFHPDVNKAADAEDRFKEISEAYEVLIDDQKRQAYNMYGEAGVKGAGAGFGGAGSPFSNPFDLFEQFFGGGLGGFGGMGGMGQDMYRATRGESRTYSLQLDFNEAVFGCEKEINNSRLVECQTCTGSGVKAGTTPSTCSQCGGSGQMVSAVRTPLGVFQQISTCDRCQGTGQISTSCEKCGGDGRVRETKKISVTVPAGVDAGTRLRVSGEGDVGRRGGPAGDLFVTIAVKAHPTLRREGFDIHSDVSIHYTDAILGSSVQVETVDGKVDLRIPPGTQPGTTMVMSKKGVPMLGEPSQRGNHLVHVSVTIPKSLSDEERKLVDELKRLQAQSKTGFGAFFGARR